MTSEEDEASPNDEGWIVLTEGMEPYERFRYIVTKILESALDEARPYALDERLFADLAEADEEGIRAHLERLDDELREDERLSELERAFLCATIGSVLEDHGGQARCYEELLPFARSIDGESSLDP